MADLTSAEINEIIDKANTGDLTLLKERWSHEPYDQNNTLFMAGIWHPKAVRWIDFKHRARLQYSPKRNEGYDFIMAAGEGDISKIQDLLKINGYSVEVFRTALLEATKNINADVVEFLWSRPEITDKAKRDAIIESSKSACQYQDASVLSWILEQNDPAITKTALIEARNESFNPNDSENDQAWVVLNERILGYRVWAAISPVYESQKWLKSKSESFSLQNMSEIKKDFDLSQYFIKPTKHK